MSELVQTERLIAGVQLLGRTGAKDFSIQYVELDAYPNTFAWIATAKHKTTGGEHISIGADMIPERAVDALCEKLIDGGRCTHCGRITGYEADPAAPTDGPADEFVCWYQYDPELKTFRRSCEGDAP